MAINFFEAQQAAHHKVTWSMFYLVIAIIAIVIFIDLFLPTVILLSYLYNHLKSNTVNLIDINALYNQFAPFLPT